MPLLLVWFLVACNISLVIKAGKGKGWRGSEKESTGIKTNVAQRSMTPMRLKIGGGNRRRVDIGRLPVCLMRGWSPEQKVKEGRGIWKGFSGMEHPSCGDRHVKMYDGQRPKCNSSLAPQGIFPRTPRKIRPVAETVLPVK